MLLCHLQHLLKKKTVNTSYPDDYFSFVVNAKRQVCVLRLNRYLSKGGCPKQKSRYRETKSFSKCFFSRWFLGKKSDILRPRKSKIWKIERKKKKNPRYGKHICQFLGPIECCHMTSRRPYWCPKTMRRRPCWSPKPILWELSSFLDFHFNSNKRITRANQNSWLGTYSNTNVILITTEWMICKVPSLYCLHHFPPLAAVFVLETSWITFKIVAF